MVKKRVFILVYCLLISGISRSQEFKYPSFLRAVEKGTRTFEGIPGENYFQNHADYQIEVSFEPRDGQLEGVARIMYYNTSQDTLRKLVIRLYQDILKKGGVRDEEIVPEAVTQGVDIFALKLNGKDLTQKIPRLIRHESTNAYLALTDPLNPYSSILIELSWRATLPPEDVHRFGRYGMNNYFVAYWYPQVAVYDDLDGWDELNYNGTQEFYNDFNSYDVRIKVPGNYMVWATGNWINPQEILSADCLNRWKSARESEVPVPVISGPDLEKKSWRINGKPKSFHFRIDSIPDFAFAVSDRYVWDAASVIIDSAKNQRVVVNAAYPEGTHHFNQVAEIGTKVIAHFGNSSFGVTYPYPAVTVFKGEGGMEFPMMVNNGDRFFYNGTVFLTMHEVAHAYFPFLTGINERKYAWMDEGLTTYLPMETEIAMGSDVYTIGSVIRNYEMMAGTEYDIPMGISSYYTRGSAYDYHTYMRSTVAFHMLENYMGRDTFRLAVADFMAVWQYKHPTPYDFFALLQKHADKDILWYVDQWFYQQGWPDLAIGELEQEADTLRIDVENRGNFNVPVKLELVYEKEASDFYSFGPEVWKNQEVLSLIVPLKGKPVKLLLNQGNIPDKYRSDNIYSFPPN